MRKKISTIIVLIFIIAALRYSLFYVTALDASLRVFYSIQGLSLFFAYYYTIIGYIGLFRLKKRPIINRGKFHSFAVLVSAHNEEKVIGDIIDNLEQLYYPKNLYDVYVLCDNCTDNTAAIVKSKRHAITLERNDPLRVGKGYGLEWAFDKLWELEDRGKKYDAIVMFDADNLVSKSFLMFANDKLLEGHEVIQGYLDCKNPTDNWITKAYAFSYWSTNRTFQLARENLGLSAQLGGSGVIVTTKVIKEIGWGSTSLTEDLEFTQRYILETGKRVAWAHDAKVYDEKPTGIRASWKQRVRWMSGHADCMVRYFPRMLKEAIRKGSLLHLDGAIYLVQPSRIVISSVLLFAVAISFIPAPGAYKFLLYGRLTFLNRWVALAGMLGYYSLPFVGLILEGKAKAIWWTVGTYIYSLTWMPITLLGIVRRKEKNWAHTQHARSMSINDLTLKSSDIIAMEEAYRCLEQAAAAKE